MSSHGADPASVRRVDIDDLPPFERESYLRAFHEAAHGLSEHGVPVGAALTRGSGVVATGRNRRVQLGDPIAHGEMDCLRVAGRQATYRDTVLFTTLAPCMMCTGTILQFKIPRVVVGENENFPGFLDLLASEGVQVDLLQHADSIALMREFIETYPDVWFEDIAE